MQYFWSHFDSQKQNLTKINSGSSNIRYHTSHITYCMETCKFYKNTYSSTIIIFHIQFKRYFLIEVTVLVKQTPMSSEKQLNNNFHVEKKNIPRSWLFQRNPEKFKLLLLFFKSDYKSVSNHKSETYTLSVFNQVNVYVSDLSYLTIFSLLFKEKKQKA